jgi:protein ImuB
MLWLCLAFPQLPLEIFTRAARTPNSSGPLAVSDGPGGRTQHVSIANEAARRCGIHAGMPLAAAHALAANLHVCERDLPAERAALERLAAWALQFTSHVSLAPPQMLLLEIGGSLRLFGGLTALREAVQAGIERLGYRAQLAVAPTPLAATWLARAGKETPVVDLRALAGRLFELPLACLDLDDTQQALLRGLGLRTLGECLRLPRDGLARRLGGSFILALDRAFGRLPDPREFYTAPPTFAARLALPGVVDHAEGVLFPLNRLLLELGGVLTARVAGVQRLELALHHPKAPCTKIELGLARPTRDTRHLNELFREHLARIELPGPVEEVALRASTLLPLAASETDFFEPRNARPEAAAELIERLNARLGRDAVRGLRTVAEHRPERAWRYSEPGTAASNDTPNERPLWLLNEPIPLDVHDGHPQLDGALELEADCERIETGWWDGADIRRDYFVARDPAGARWWVFRELSAEGRWWVQGAFG